MGTIASGLRGGLVLAGCLAACGGSISHQSGDTRGEASASGGGKGGSPGKAGGDVDETMPAIPAGGTTVSVSGTAGKAGSVGAGGRAAGAAGASHAGTGSGPCPGKQVLLNGMCACPAYAPTYCAVGALCVNAAKDPDHCGECNTQCGAVNACSLGVCTADPITFGQAGTCGTLLLQLANGKLYGLTTRTGKLFSITLPVGGAPVAIASELSLARAFAVDGGYAYVATGLTVTQVNLASGVKTTLVSETATIFDIAVANGKIYYATGKDIKQADAAAPSVGIAVASAIDEGEPQGVAIASSAVLYVSNASFNVEVEPIAGDGHAKVGASQAGLIFGHRSVQADASNVYWINGGVQSAPIIGPEHPLSTVAQPIDGSPIVAFAIDSSARMAYFATADGNFEKSSFDQGLAGEEATWVLRGLGAGAKVSSIVLGDTSAYIASGCDILQTPR